MDARTHARTEGKSGKKQENVKGVRVGVYPKMTKQAETCSKR
jgi:hypothetical protein